MMISSEAAWVILGLGLVYLGAILGLFGLGLWLMLGRRRRPWLGGVILLAVLAWAFGPWAIGQARLVQARTMVEALQISLLDLPLAGQRIVIVTMQGSSGCEGLCFDLLDSGLVDELHVVEADFELDFDRLAVDPLGALVDDRAILWHVRMGPPQPEFGRYRLPETERRPMTGLPETDLVLIEDRGAFLTEEAWAVLMPGLENPAAGHEERRVADALLAWRGWPAPGTTPEPDARLVSVEFRVPDILIWFASTRHSDLPEPGFWLIQREWLCRAGDLRHDRCAHE